MDELEQPQQRQWKAEIIIINNNYIRKFKNIGGFLSNTRQPDVGFLQSWGESLTSVFFFSQIVSLREKTLKNINLVPSRHFKRVKDSLPVDMHYSKTSLLKLPYYETTKSTTSR